MIRRGPGGGGGGGGGGGASCIAAVSAEAGEEGEPIDSCTSLATTHTGCLLGPSKGMHRLGGAIWLLGILKVCVATRVDRGRENAHEVEVVR